MEIDKNLLIKINELIGSDNKVIVSEEDVMYMLEELVSEIERLEEEFENYYSDNGGENCTYYEEIYYENN